MQIIDLRSDTVTRPSPEMRGAMMDAEVGDDVFGEDPTVNRLEEELVGLLGKEAALFVPSGTMGNEICVKYHTRPGDEVICEAGCHIYNYESGAAGFLSGVQMRPVEGERGVITVEQVAAVVQPPHYYLPRTRLITVENTHNRAGGTIFPLEELARLYDFARQQSLPLHLDGARLWNASVATGVPVKEYARRCDTVSVCFSKGLGAPIGSAVAGTQEFIEEARRLRKIFGGGMRQVGIVAAAARYALHHNVERLAEDHANARHLAERLAELPGVGLDLASVQTNIVIFDVADSGRSAGEVSERLRDRGVLMVPFGPTTLRAVTHLHITREAVEQAAEAIAAVVA